jgi:hypothetical protein
MMAKIASMFKDSGENCVGCGNQGVKHSFVDQLIPCIHVGLFDENAY